MAVQGMPCGICKASPELQGPQDPQRRGTQPGDYRRGGPLRFAGDARESFRHPLDEYGEIRYEILWTIVRDKLTPLIERLEATGADSPPPEEE